jgi:hypothetical protein
MKHIMFLVTMFAVSACFVVDQTDRTGCEVLKEGISDSYIGNCRRGLAHGFGKASGDDRYEGQFRRGLPHGPGEYVWANGDQYTGLWFNGVMHGEGTFYDAEIDSVYSGRWDNGQYQFVKYPRPEAQYVVRYRSNITRFRFNRIIDGNRVFFKIPEAAQSRRISQLSTYGSSGQYFVYTNMFGYEEVEFPFSGRISFVGPSRTGATQYLVQMTFEINEPGYWEVIIYY